MSENNNDLNQNKIDEKDLDTVNNQVEDGNNLGEDTTEKVSEDPIDVEKQVTENVNNIDDDDDSLYEDGHDEDDEDHDSKNKIIFAGVGIIALVVIALFLVLGQNKKNPLDRILIGCSNIYNKRSFSLMNEVSFNIDADNQEFLDKIGASNDEKMMDYLNFASSLAPKFKFVTEINSDFTSGNLVFSMNPSLLYNDNRIVGANFAINHSDLGISSDDFLVNPIYANLDDYLMQNAGIKFSDLDIPSYIDIILEKDEFISNLPKSQYIATLKEVLTTEGEDAKVKLEGKEEIEYFGNTIKADKISVNYTLKDTKDILQKWNEIARTDENLKKSVLAKYDKIVEHMTESKVYETYADDLVTFLEEVKETRNKLENNWEETIDEVFGEILQGFEEGEVLNEDDVITQVYYMDSNNIKRVDAVTKIEGIEITSKTSYTGYDENKVNLASAENSDSIDVLLSPNFTNMVITNLYNNVMMKDNFNNMIEDIKKEAFNSLPEKEATELAGSIDSGISMVKWYVNLFGVNQEKIMTSDSNGEITENELDENLPDETEDEVEEDASVKE